MLTQAKQLVSCRCTWLTKMVSTLATFTRPFCHGKNVAVFPCDFGGSLAS